MISDSLCMDIEILYICWSTLTQTQKLPESERCVRVCPAASREDEHPYVLSAEFSREHIYEVLVQLFVSSGATNYICWRYLVMAFAISHSGFPLTLETCPPSIYLQWWYQRAPREREGTR